MKIHFTIIGFLISYLSVGQVIDIKKKSNDAIVAFEKENNGIIKDTVDFGILKNPIKDQYTLKKTKAVIFKRDLDSFEPKLHVWYHFDVENNELSCIRYNWGLYNPSFNARKEKELLNRIAQNESQFIKKYKNLNKELSKQLGKPVLTTTVADNERSFREFSFWEDEEKFVELSIKFDRQAGEYSDYEIEVTVTFKD